MKTFRIYELKELFRSIKAAELLGLEYKIETAIDRDLNFIGMANPTECWVFKIYGGREEAK